MSGYVARMRLRAAKRSQPLVRRVAHQGLQAQTNGFRIRGGAAGQFRFSKQVFIDIEGLLHPYKYTIRVWLSAPGGVCDIDVAVSRGSEENGRNLSVHRCSDLAAALEAGVSGLLSAVKRRRILAQGGAAGATLGHQACRAQSPVRAMETCRSPRSYRALRKEGSVCLPRVAPAAPPWAIFHRRFAAFQSKGNSIVSPQLSRLPQRWL